MSMSRPRRWRHQLASVALGIAVLGGLPGVAAGQSFTGFDDDPFALDFTGGDAWAADDTYGVWGFPSDPWTGAAANTWSYQPDPWSFPADPWSFPADPWINQPTTWGPTAASDPWGAFNSYDFGWGMDTFGWGFDGFGTPGGFGQPIMGGTPGGFGQPIMGGNQTPAPALPPTQTTGGTNTDATAALEARVVELTNAHRASAGCPALRVDSRLTAAARGHSTDMANRRYFSHTSPDGATLQSRVEAQGYRWASLGENIAADYASPEAVVERWMSSPGHRANIVNCGLTEIGVGYDRQNWTQDFASPG